jgi:hypothetical protein
MCAETNTALLTGTFALAGVALSIATSALLSWWEKSHKRKVLLREKYEEFGFLFLSSFDMPQKLMNYQGNTGELLSQTHQIHGNKMYMLALLYSPELQKLVGEYIHSYSELCIVAHSLYDQKSELLLGEQIHNHPKYMTAAERHISARDSLQGEISEYAVKYATV